MNYSIYNNWNKLPLTNNEDVLKKSHLHFVSLFRDSDDIEVEMSEISIKKIGR